MREIHACFGRLTTDFACDNWNGNGVLEEHSGARFESITILSVIKKKRLKRKYFSLIFSDSCLRFYGGLRPPSRNRVEVDVCEEEKIEADVKKVSDFPSMLRKGILSLPAVAVNGTVKVTGRVPDRAELLKWFKEV